MVTIMTEKYIPEEAQNFAAPRLEVTPVKQTSGHTPRHFGIATLRRLLDFVHTEKVVAPENQEIDGFAFGKIQEIIDTFHIYDSGLYGQLLQAAYFSDRNFSYRVVDETDEGLISDTSTGIFLIKDTQGQIVEIRGGNVQNESVESAFFATGQNSYFAEYIASNGFGSLQIKDEDLQDIQYLQTYAHPGSEVIVKKREDYATYMAVPGEIEYHYATDSLPALVAEEAFGLPPTHQYYLNPIVGESEAEYVVRNLLYKIGPHISDAEKVKIVTTAKRLADKFCGGDAYVYLVPCQEILDHEVSFGDVPEKRGGQDGDVQLETLREIIHDNHSYNFSSDPNFNSELGLAVYGAIPHDRVFALRLPNKYTQWQKMAQERGLPPGSEIPAELMQTLD